MEISAKTFLIEQRIDPYIIKIIDSITFKTTNTKFKKYFIHPSYDKERQISQIKDSPHAKIIVPDILKLKI